MTFGHPLLLLTLLVLPLAVALYLWLDRRPVRHARPAHGLPAAPWRLREERLDSVPQGIVDESLGQS